MQIKERMPRKKADHSAILHMATKRMRWSNTFRISISLRDKIDPEILQCALEAVAPRFPYLFSGVRAGLFWYYLEPVDAVAPATPDKQNPLEYMSSSAVRKQAIRILYGENSIAVEPYHSITDGYGCLVFLKTFVAEYITLRYGTHISNFHDKKCIEEGPQPREYEDSFSHHANDAFSLENVVPSAFLPSFKKTSSTEVSTGIFDVNELLAIARSFGVTITTLFSAAMMDALQMVQSHHMPLREQWKPVRVAVPIDLRNLYDSDTLHNFTMYAMPEIDPRAVDYDFDELLHITQHQIDMQRSVEYMSAQIGNNVRLEQHPIVQRLPLPIKKLGLKAGLFLYGDRKYCLSISNLGPVQFPPEMSSYIRRIDFMLTPKVDTLYNCGAISFDGKLYFNITRKTNDVELADQFFDKLSLLGVRIKRESSESLAGRTDELVRKPQLA